LWCGSTELAEVRLSRLHSVELLKKYAAREGIPPRGRHYFGGGAIRVVYNCSTGKGLCS
jgi:hypothetical protein